MLHSPFPTARELVELKLPEIEMTPLVCHMRSPLLSALFLPLFVTEEAKILRQLQSIPKNLLVNLPNTDIF